MATYDINGMDLDTIRDAEFERVWAFNETLKNIRMTQSVDTDINFGDERPVAFAQKRFLAFEHSDDRLTLYTNPEVVTTEPEHYSFVPRISRAGKLSQHGVFFGDLSLGNGQEVAVAVKPHVDERRASCLDEYFNNDAVHQLGIYTLTSMGFILGDREEEPAYSLTILKEGLTTLDSIDWSEFFPDISANPGMQEMWRSIAGQAATLHDEGNKSHGDLAGRNIADTVNAGGQEGTFFIDWETADIRQRKPRDAEVRFNRSYGDLSTLMESMCLPPKANYKSGIGIFFGKTGDWWQGFRDIFFDEYLDVRRGLSVQGNQDRSSRADIAEELKELEISLHAETDRQRAVCESMIGA